MRTTARLLTGVAFAAASIGLFGPGAYAGERDALEVFPSSASPGESVTVSTTACGKGGHGVGEARELGVREFQLTPATHKEVATGSFSVPHKADSGTYKISVTCDNGKKASGDLVVHHRDQPDHPTQPTHRPTHHGMWPSGHVPTGVGGSVGPDYAQMAAGGAVLAGVAVAGALMLRRRANGTRNH
ncbi:hypothetical protein QCN29_33640 [Streptomyces sp. HNM0663]|uniref:Sortase n=1 Tax=Streptomyces chengmaiensis TaxID=3040919 RepID=A0ABT6HYD1_9ACTN|nr:hypothetical protein [Streptomyces chengmaiensis]MDH2393620.1 hypothetical protein [Streptomyces chengmaiensis]